MGEKEWNVKLLARVSRISLKGAQMSQKGANETQLRPVESLSPVLILQKDVYLLRRK